MIDSPPPPAAPKSDHRSDRPCHPKVAGQTYCLQKLERATTTVDVPKTLLKCQSLSDQGSLVVVLVAVTMVAFKLGTGVPPRTPWLQKTRENRTKGSLKAFL